MDLKDPCSLIVKHPLNTTNTNYAPDASGSSNSDAPVATTTRTKCANGRKSVNASLDPGDDHIDLTVAKTATPNVDTEQSAAPLPSTRSAPDPYRASNFSSGIYQAQTAAKGKRSRYSSRTFETDGELGANQIQRTISNLGTPKT